MDKISMGWAFSGPNLHGMGPPWTRPPWDGILVAQISTNSILVAQISTNGNLVAQTSPGQDLSGQVLHERALTGPDLGVQAQTPLWGPHCRDQQLQPVTHPPALNSTP